MGAPAPEALRRERVRERERERGQAAALRACGFFRPNRFVTRYNTDTPGRGTRGHGDKGFAMLRAPRER